MSGAEPSLEGGEGLKELSSSRLPPPYQVLEAETEE